MSAQSYETAVSNTGKSARQGNARVRGMTSAARVRIAALGLRAVTGGGVVVDPVRFGEPGPSPAAARGRRSARRLAVGLALLARPPLDEILDAHRDFLEAVRLDEPHVAQAIAGIDSAAGKAEDAYPERIRAAGRRTNGARAEDVELDHDRVRAIGRDEVEGRVRVVRHEHDAAARLEQQSQAFGMVGLTVDDQHSNPVHRISLVMDPVWGPRIPDANSVRTRTVRRNEP